MEYCIDGPFRLRLARRRHISFLNFFSSCRCSRAAFFSQAARADAEPALSAVSALTAACASLASRSSSSASCSHSASASHVSRFSLHSTWYIGR